MLGCCRLESGWKQEVNSCNWSKEGLTNAFDLYIANLSRSKYKEKDLVSNGNSVSKRMKTVFWKCHLITDILGIWEHKFRYVRKMRNGLKILKNIQSFNHCGKN